MALANANITVVSCLGAKNNSSINLFHFLFQESPSSPEESFTEIFESQQRVSYFQFNRQFTHDGSSGYYSYEELSLEGPWLNLFQAPSHVAYHSRSRIMQKYTKKTDIRL